MSRTRLVIVGAGGFGREVRQYAAESFATDAYVISGFLDDRAEDTAHLGSLASPLLGTIAGYEPSRGERFLVAIGEPRVRARICAMLAERGAEFETIVHPLAYVASSAQIGPGAIIAPFASVGACAKIGSFAHVHFYASAAHDTVIGDFASLSPYAVANGGSSLEEGVFLGTRATINPLKRVGRFARVTAGSVVYQDVPAGSIAHGNPAKSRRQLNGDQPAAPSVMSSETTGLEVSEGVK